MHISPIIIFTYNRLNHLDTLIQSLQKNVLFEKSKVIVFSDGPKNEIDKKKIKKIRIYLKKKLISSNCEIIERSSNYGLSKNIIDGINHTFKKYDQAIILEDDLEVSPIFLNYMNDALNLYASSKNVASISGYMYPIDKLRFSNNFFFLNLIESWGWGTWSRSWKLFQSNSIRLKQSILDNKLKKKFNLNNSFNYFKILDDNIQKRNDSWAVRWYATVLLNNMLTLFPSKSFVLNKGFDNSGTHCGITNVYESNLIKLYKGLPKIEVYENPNDRLQLEIFFKKIKYKNLFRRVLRFFFNISK
jgi:hypothetical protein